MEPTPNQTTRFATTMDTVKVISVAKGEEGMRLDRWFKAHYPGLRHGQLEKLLRKGNIRVNGARVKAHKRLEAHDMVRVPPLGDTEAPPKVSAPRKREDADYLRSITLYEDADILALNKPFGLAVQGGAKTTRHIDGMLAALEKSDDRPRLVHRLDRDTGGLLLIARNRAAAAALGAGLQRRDVEKTYWALVAGAPKPRRGTVDLPIAKRMTRGVERMAPADDDDAKEAVTDYQVIDDAGPTAAFLALRPRTGRTHQLRVHCAAMGTPIVGDGKYGGATARIDGVAPRLHLFCRSMTFAHPKTGRPMTLTAPLTGHMLDTWTFFGFDLDAKAIWPRVE